MTTITTYNFMIKALDSLGRESTTAATASLSGAPSVSVDSNLIGADDYLSSTFFYHNRFESLDGFDNTNATLSATSGSVILAPPSPTAGYAYKIINTTPSWSFTKKLKFKSEFKITSGTGQYLNFGALNGIHAGSGLSSFFGVIALWNSGTSKIDLYARTINASNSNTDTLLTSINDTGIRVNVESTFTPGVDVVLKVTISGVDYSATITTNLPTGDLTYPMYLRVSSNVGTSSFEIYDFKSSQQ